MRWKHGLPWWEDLAEVTPLVEVLHTWGMEVTNFGSGAVFTDGSVIFTNTGSKNVGNPLEVKQRVFGRLVEFTGRTSWP